MTGVLAPPPITRLALAKAFLGVLLPFALLLGAVAGMHYYTHFTTERGALESRETLNVQLARHTLANDISNVVSDLMFLAEDLERQGLLDAGTREGHRRIGDEFSTLARNKGLYDQIRYLDLQGMEVVRINYAGGRPEFVPAQALQDKSDRYYAAEALRLERGGLYVSPLDLNVEEGRIEQPHKPMMRFATPLFDRRGEKRGLLVLNYLGQRLIDNFIRATANVADHIHLLNRQGYWLRSPDRTHEWAFMFGDPTRFSARHPQVWQRMNTQESGQMETPAGLFSFTGLRPLETALGGQRYTGPLPGREAASINTHWFVMAHVAATTLSETPWQFLRRHLPLYLSMLMLIGIGSWLLARSQLRSHQMEAQNEYEQLFRRSLENTDLVAVSLDRTGRVTFCNDHFLKTTGWRRQEVIGRPWIDEFIAPQQREATREILHRTDDPEAFPTRYRSQILCRDGRSCLIAWSNTLSYDADGHYIGIMSIGDDITNKHQQAEELRKLYRAVEQSPSIVLITNREGVIEYVNPKFTEITGYQPEEVIGHNPRVLKSGDTSSDEYSSLWHTIREGGEWRGEFHNRKKNGELYWESASISAIRDTEGRITHYLAVKENITERKRLEQEVEARNQELARNQALAAMGRMASMIAHDLRNPLSSVKMGVQILGKHAAGNAEAGELQQIALEQIRYMEEILSDMLSYSRPDALKPEWIDIGKLLQTAVGISQRRIDQLGVDLLMDIQPGLPTFQGDITKLRQVFSNLIVNAAQATVEQPRPRVGIRAMLQLGPDGTGIQVEVLDNGSGIDPEVRNKMFEPFFTTNSKGTGLGLAIVKRILDQHHADIILEDLEPQGTCAIVVLPRVLPDGTEQNSQTEPEVQALSEL